LISLDRMGNAKEESFVGDATNELQPNGQAVRSSPTRNGNRREAT